MKMNRHAIAGRLVEEPEYGSIPGSGIPTIKLRVQTDDGWYDQKKQEYQKRNTYHTVKRVGKDVDKMELRKDDWVFCEGQRLTDSWEGRDNEKKYADFLRAAIIVEIPDPWEKRDTRGSSSDSGGGRDDRDSDRGSRRDRDRDSRDSRGRDDRGRGRDDRGRDNDRGRDSGRDRDDQSRPGDGGIPF